jgi:hypothetical protein
MKKKDIFSILFILIALVLIIYAISTRKKVAVWGEPLESDHIPAWTEVRYDSTLEMTVVEEHDDIYYLWYDVKYEDGSTGAEKQKVSEQEYLKYINNK